MSVCATTVSLGGFAMLRMRFRYVALDSVHTLQENFVKRLRGDGKECPGVGVAEVSAGYMLAIFLSLAPLRVAAGFLRSHSDGVLGAGLDGGSTPPTDPKCQCI
jgi:hypothetical protein